MSWIVKARTTPFDVCLNLFSLKSGDKNATPPNSSNDTVKHRAEVSTSDDEPKSLWSRLWKIVVDAWHKIIKTFIEG